MRLEEHFVDTPGAVLFVRAAGPRDGLPIVLLHGWPDTGAGWLPVAERLAGRYRLLIPDNRGFGMSSMPETTADYKIRAVLGDLAALLDWADVDRAGVAGHDFGGAVAWNAGTFLPDRVDRIAVCSVPHPMNWRRTAVGDLDQLSRSFYVWLLNAGEKGERLLAAQDFRLLREHMYGDVLDGDEEAALLESWREPGRFHAMAEWYRAGYNPDLLNPDVPLSLPPVTVPTLYMHGLEDWAFVPALAYGNGEFVDADYEELIIPEAGHWLPRTHPRLVAERLAVWFG